MTVYLGNKVINLQIDGEDCIFKISDKVHYVSLGDSIAAGHAINDDWYNEYETDSQYGENGNTSTAIVPQSYTDLIAQELKNINVGKLVLAKSFAHSGDTVGDLMEKLSHNIVRKAIKKADLVTICIGANDVLQPALSHLDEYINTGDLSSLEVIVEANLANLNNDAYATSYKALFDTLSSINSNAKYVFTTIYNPYKYLWIEEGKNGFFSPVLNTIPQMTILGFEIDDLIKDGLLNTSIVKQLFSRINGLNAWAEKYVTRLNQVLSSKINSYKATNPNFLVADTKSVFDTVPDRPISAQYHYNDLVNVEYTRGYDTMQMDWGRMYEGTDAGTFWWDLATKYVSLSGFNIEGFATELINDNVIAKVIMSDIDPHPEWYGHYVLKRSFVEEFGWESLEHRTITFNANGGTGSMASQTIVGIDGLPSYVNINPLTFTPVTGYHFMGWNTKADGTGTSYSDGQLVGISSDTTLYAQWSNILTINYMHTNHTNLYGDDETGHKECYALFIDGVEQADFGTFAEGTSRLLNAVYGSTIRVVVSSYNPTELTYDDVDCGVYFNGTNVASGYRGTEYTFTLTTNVIIDFRWKIAGSLATFDAKSWEDCYITTG